MRIRHITRALLLAFFFVTSSFGQLVTNEITFYLHPDLVATTNMGAIKTNLVKYVEDVNYVLAKNTLRRWGFNPNTGIIVTNSSPSNGIEPIGGGPTNEFPVWVWVQRSYSGSSFGGSLGIDSSGPGVINSLFWRAFYDPDTLTNLLNDYEVQLITMIHEYGHIFGVAGVNTGEYYKLGPVFDDTPDPPTLNTRFLIFTNGAVQFAFNDPYWTHHLDFSYEPMLWNPTVSNVMELLTKTRFSPLSAEIINRRYRAIEHSPPLPNLTQLRVKIGQGHDADVPITVIPKGHHDAPFWAVILKSLIGGHHVQRFWPKRSFEKLVNCGDFVHITRTLSVAMCMSRMFTQPLPVWTKNCLFMELSATCASYVNS